MPEIIPVKTLRVILFSEAVKVIDNNQESFITQHRIHIFHTGAEIINNNPSAHEFSLIHIKGRGQNINIDKRVNISSNQQNLTISRSKVLNTEPVVLIRHERKHVRSCLNISYNIVRSSSSRRVGLHISEIRFISGEKLLHGKEFVKISARIQRINNTSDKSTETILASERLCKGIVLNSGLIEKLTIHLMIHRVDIGNFTLINFTRRNLRIVLTSICDINKNLFDNVAVTLGTLLKRSERILVKTRRDHYTSNTIYENRKKLVCNLKITTNNIPNIADIGGSRFWNTTAKHNHFRTHSINNLRISSIKNYTHNLLPPFRTF